MTNYVKVRRDGDDDVWPWRWECAICLCETHYFKHRYALAWGQEHARTCLGVRAAMERDWLRSVLGQALTILHRYRMQVHSSDPHPR